MPAELPVILVAFGLAVVLIATWVLGKLLGSSAADGEGAGDVEAVRELLRRTLGGGAVETPDDEPCWEVSLDEFRCTIHHDATGTSAEVGVERDPDGSELTEAEYERALERGFAEQPPHAWFDAEDRGVMVVTKASPGSERLQRCIAARTVALHGAGVSHVAYAGAGLVDCYLTASAPAELADRLAIVLPILRDIYAFGEGETRAWQARARGAAIPA